MERGIQMEANYNGRLQKKRINRFMTVTIVALVLLVGGSVAAFVLMDKSPKASYFLYERNTMDMFSEQVESRYEPELEWEEKSLENPIENNYELSATVHAAIAAGNLPVTVDQVLNNSVLNVTSNVDRENKQFTAEMNGSFGNFEVGDVNLYLTSDNMMLGLPFLNEILQLNGDDFGKLMQELQPEGYTGEEKIDFNMLFEGNVLSEDDLAYIEKEYMQSIYNALPEEAFEAVDETVRIGESDVTTEKITFHLTEDQLKTLLTDTLTKMADDDKMQDIMLNAVLAHDYGPFVFGSNPNFGITNFETDYDTVLKDALAGINDIAIPNGFTSTIWVEDELVVKRDLMIDIGPTAEQLTNLYVKGELEHDSTEQAFEYDFGMIDQGLEQTLSVDGTLSHKDGKIKDSITLAMDNTTLIYQSNETLDNGKRDFERVFTLEDGTGYTFDLTWSGNATYHDDQMNSEHEFSVANNNQDVISLYLDKNAKQTDSITLPQEQLKDIGAMNAQEFRNYFESEVTPQFEEWLMGIIGFGF